MNPNPEPTPAPATISAQLPPDTRRHPIQGDHIDELVNWQLLAGPGY
jgi:hypothetical protein